MANPPPIRAPPTRSSIDCDSKLMPEPIRTNDAKRQKTPAKKRIEEESGIAFQVCAFSAQELILSRIGANQFTVQQEVRHKVLYARQKIASESQRSASLACLSVKASRTRESRVPSLRDSKANFVIVTIRRCET